MTKVAIAGSGFIGRAWAISFARAGHRIAMWDQSPEATAGALDYIAGVLGDLQRNDLLRGQEPAEVLARIGIERDLEAALDGAEHVQESTPENLAIKIDVFSRLDVLADAEAVIASSTSALLPSAFTESLAGRQR